jgi:hypothetical protein
MDEFDSIIRANNMNLGFPHNGEDGFSAGGGIREPVRPFAPRNGGGAMVTIPVIRESTKHKELVSCP